MNNLISAQPLSILLSREELLAILDSLDTNFIPGLDPDPLGDLTPEGRGLALTVARRALLARELARMGDDGQILIHRAALSAVGVCAYSQGAVLAYHWPAGADVAARFMGHVRGGEAVAHTRPADVLHRLQVLPSKADLVEKLLEFCECAEPTEGASPDFDVDREAFAAARQLATSAGASQAAATLVGSGTAPADAEALVATLAASPRVSVIQLLKQRSDQEVSSQEFTLLQDDRRAWWVTAAATGPVHVRTTSPGQVRSALQEWL